MNKERLLTLAKHLRTVSTTRFKMANWTCGAAACAVGHACEIPEFNVEGFRLVPTTPRQYRKAVLIPFYQGYDNWLAVQQFFTLRYSQAEQLFGQNSYGPKPTPADVAERIEEHVKRYLEKQA